jgi:predicted esterase
MGVKRHIHPRKKRRIRPKQAKREAEAAALLDAKEAAAKAKNQASGEQSTEVKETAAIVWLHGLGDCGASWKSLATAIGLPHIKWVLPDAPHQPVSCNGGSYMPSWFDLKAIPVVPGAWDDETGLDGTIKRIHSIIAKLEKRNGISPDRIMVGGFSQGGCVSLLAVLTSDTKLAGVMCLSGWLARANEYPGLIQEKDSKKTPIFWGHGDKDDKVLYSTACKGRDKLSPALGSLLTFKTYAGMEHCTNTTEEKDLREWLEQHLPADPNVRKTSATSSTSSITSSTTTITTISSSSTTTTTISTEGAGEGISIAGREGKGKQKQSATLGQQKTQREKQVFTIKVSKKKRK